MANAEQLEILKQGRSLIVELSDVIKPAIDMAEGLGRDKSKNASLLFIHRQLNRSV